MRVIVFILMMVPGFAWAQSTSADAYRVAAQRVPVGRDEWQRLALEHSLDAPLDDAAAVVLKEGQTSLQLFDAATQMAFGGWGLDETDPTYGGRAIKGLTQLGDLVVLRARFKADQGDLDGALTDCYRVALLSSRLSDQPSLTRQIQQNELMKTSLEMAASLLPRLSVEQIERFTSRLGELREPADPVVVARIEEESYLWLYGRLIEDDSIRRLAARAAGTLNAMFGIQTQPIDVEDLARDPELAGRVLNETRDVFAKLIAALKESPQERAAAMRIISRQYDFSHDLSRGAAQLVMQTYRQHAEQTTRTQMFLAAVRIYSDPARPIDSEKAGEMARPFDLRPNDGGLELYGKVVEDAPPIVLRVGPRVGPTTKNQGKDEG